MVRPMNQSTSRGHEAPGFAARRIAADVLDAVLRRARPLDEQFDNHPALASLPERDRALVRMLAATALRRLGTLRDLLARCLSRGLPAEAPRVETALLLGATQILFLDIPDHAAVDLAVRLVQADRRAARYAGLVNAVLRRLAREGKAWLAEIDPTRDTPDWLLTRWSRAYGADTAAAMAAVHQHEPATDLSIKTDPELWAQRLHGRVLPTGTVRSLVHGAVSLWPGYDEGAWWVQDTAASLPARLLGPVAGRRVADLCAAPGGKTSQLALAGAAVTAVDRSEIRLRRLAQNLVRLGTRAETVIADAGVWEAEPFDAVLLDAPCTATGTIRRHPDVQWLKHPEDIAALAEVQARLLDRAVALTRPGGVLVYCTCSLEPEEGEAQIEALLARDPRVALAPLQPADIPGLPESAVTARGTLRTLPTLFPDPDPRWAGCDGFFAARLTRV